MTIHSYGFFYSKKNNEISQEYHIDYLPELISLFIPMVHLTTQNATRFMKGLPKSKPTQGSH